MKPQPAFVSMGCKLTNYQLNLVSLNYLSFCPIFVFSWKLHDAACKSFEFKFAQNNCFLNRGQRFQAFTYLGGFTDSNKLQSGLAVVIDIPKFYSISLEDLLQKINEPTDIPIISTVFVLNGNLYQRRTSYCIQQSSDKAGIISKYVNVQGDLVVRRRCFGKPVRAIGNNYIRTLSNHCA